MGHSFQCRSRHPDSDSPRVFDNNRIDNPVLHYHQSSQCRPNFVVHDCNWLHHAQKTKKGASPSFTIQSWSSRLSGEYHSVIIFASRLCNVVFPGSTSSRCSKYELDCTDIWVGHHLRFGILLLVCKIQIRWASYIRQKGLSRNSTFGVGY
jgi:hypothetical protein